jgi:protein-disulfide isomerase
MQRLFTKTLLSLSTVIFLASVCAPQAGAAETAFNATQKEEIGKIVHEYILDNPSIVFEAAEKYRMQQEEESAKKSEASIKEHMEFLTRADAPSAGNPKGDVTIVEFFDYNCGYCRKALSDIQTVLKNDPNVRVVFKEMPILGPTSKTAALWALAAHRQGKYFDFHVAVMDHKGPKEEAELEKLAKAVGLDLKKLKEDIASEAVQTELNKDIEIARQIGVQGTPAFIVGTSFIPGYVGEEGLKKAIAEARSKTKPQP